ncbi:hypothetical protein [Megamonas hypermegale]|nr:hypothetical protein [Megamonas hypermegale]
MIADWQGDDKVRKIITLLMMAVMLMTFSAGVFAQPKSDYDFNRVGDGYHCHYDDGHHYRSGHCW